MVLGGAGAYYYFQKQRIILNTSAEHCQRCERTDGLRSTTIARSERVTRMEMALYCRWCHHTHYRYCNLVCIPEIMSHCRENLKYLERFYLPRAVWKTKGGLRGFKPWFNERQIQIAVTRVIRDDPAKRLYECVIISISRRFL